MELKVLISCSKFFGQANGSKPKNAPRQTILSFGTKPNDSKEAKDEEDESTPPSSG